MFSTPKRCRVGPKPDGDQPPPPPPIIDGILKVSCFNIGDESPNLQEKSVISPGEATRRGRPRADLLTTLIMEGSTSPSSIKCIYCNRVFPREKSLHAHLRTHTGEKPYICDYPRCIRRFAQSGQLKTHQRLHTGEKPFICVMPNCARRFTHANRHCPDHPEQTLKRFVAKCDLLDKSCDEMHTAEVRQWLHNFDKRQRGKCQDVMETTPKKCIVFKPEESLFSSGSSAYFSGCSQNGRDDIENSPQSEMDDLDTSICSISGSENDSITGSLPRKPSELPKKRWLREATQDQQLWDSTIDLASPLNWGEENQTEDETQPERPSVLVSPQAGKCKEISNDDIQGAMALVELKNGLTNNSFNYRV